jgi:hypothetical protein
VKPYALDANTFIQAKKDHYRFEVVPGFWQWLDWAHEIGVIRSIAAVRKELLERDDRLSKWVRTRKTLFVVNHDARTLDSARQLAAWAAKTFEPYHQAEFFAAADYFLVAYAHAHHCTVVTHENRKPGRIKIPVACDEMGVKCMSPFDMLQKENARFDLRAAPDP